ncbi:MULTISPECIES: putative quinol monooxygenase [Niastella]|uniref:Antibiotic biosynthesis monooxygenase n=1 Tax=Niastella soli TaxID=2821487 RepID=A0ABS3Z5S5_9BACT|nr:antibiotic biosynthesis monooxygenase [Niastella soli]MBO9205523.1 antibiotic biosynthesis monooxygenase [Niastella soli]
MRTFNFAIRIFCTACLATALVACKADRTPQMPKKVRLAKVVVDSTQLENYKAFLKEEIEASVSKEPGVLTLYAVFEKEKPTHLTILEIYATEAAYQSHLKTTHFLKYKNGTMNMVKNLELIETDPLIPALKIK